MSEYVSLYRKDFLWPHQVFSPRIEQIGCGMALPVSPKPPEPFKTCPEGQRFISKSPRIDREVRLGACPKTESLQFSETDACLKKLIDTNPNLFAVLKKNPPTDALTKFNQERLKTTYQIAYDSSDHSTDEAKFSEERMACPRGAESRVRLEAECRPQIRSRAELMKLRRGGAWEPKTTCKDENRKTKRIDCDETPAYMLKVLPVWSSEYRDVIGKTGADIINAEKKCRSKRRRLKKRKLGDRTACDHFMTLG